MFPLSGDAASSCHEAGSYGNAATSATWKLATGRDHSHAAQRALRLSMGKDVLVTSLRDSLIARRRRLESRVSEVRAALNSSDRSGVPDAVAGALDALYDLWEYWRQRAGLTMNQADARVRGDAAGETAAALVHARGGKTHVHEEFGCLTDTYGDAYRAYYGVWRWQDYSDPRSRFAVRDGWYSSHVAREEVLPPMEAALHWMSIQPELQ